MDRLTLFGLAAVTAMLLCYAFEARSHWFGLGFAIACAAGVRLWVPAGRLAVRPGGGGLVRRGAAALVAGPRWDQPSIARVAMTGSKIRRPPQSVSVVTPALKDGAMSLAAASHARKEHA
ncbi:MAG: hypothetical protein WDN49_13810 [Acetobacteraceae bacterium]